MDKILNSLNEEQLKAMAHVDGPALVIAGAGSGKTKVLTTRIANLINNGINSSNILAITFTNKAAGEMRERVRNIVGNHYAFVGTFHSFGLRIIRENYQQVGISQNFTIIDTEDVNNIIKKIFKDLGYGPKQYSFSYMRERISFIKNNMLSDSEITRFLTSDIEKIAIKIYYEYEKILKRNNTVDFDDLLKKPVELFMEYPDILLKYQEKYQYILIDEYQDTNEVQYKLVRLLAKKYENLFVVGDPSQSIYAFRGANFKNILNFEKDYPNAVIYKLPQNYRSTQYILNAANDVIKHNTQRKDIALFSDLGKGVKIKYIRSYNDESEVTRVAEEIKNLKLDGYKLKDMAVFYRTNAQSRLIEDKMVKENIPYKIYGSFYFYKRKEIKDLLAYLKLIANPHDDISLIRVINEPKRKIGNKSIEGLENRAREKNISIFEAITEGKELEFKNIILSLIEDAKKMSLTSLVDSILDKAGIRHALEKEKCLENDLRMENLLEFRSVTENFEKITGNVNLQDFLEEVSLVADAAEYSADADAVSLMTIHSAKGLEFKIVFIIGVEENILPHVNSIYNKDELEEERRLMYVAITRAKEKLYLLNSERRMLYGVTSSNMPSRFISEIKEDNLEKEETKNKKDLITKLLYNNDIIKGEEFKKGDLINHLNYGKGVITKVDEDHYTIAFSHKEGEKKISKKYKGLRRI